MSVKNVSGKTQATIAIDKHSKMVFNDTHLTTSDFMRLNVSKIIEMVPNQSITIDHLCFSRLEPLAVPTFGNARFQHRAYFVPMRTLWRGWNDFYNDTPHRFDNDEYQYALNVPSTSTSNFVQMFNSSAYSSVVGTDSAPESYDYLFVVYASDGITVEGQQYRKFTYQGRIVYNLLRSLGYNFTFTNLENELVSLLPLYSIFKIYIDYFYPSQYAFDANFNEFLVFLDDNKWYDDGDYLGAEIQTLALVIDFVCFVNYGSDYFTSAWDNPNAPNNGLSSNFEINDIGNNPNNTLGNQVKFINGSSTYGSQPVAVGVDSQGLNQYLRGFTQYTLNALRSLSDFLKRNQLAGSKVIDRYLARFGVQLKDEKLNRSVYLGDYTQVINFSDVVSTSSTDGASLGDYAGKGMSFRDDMKWSYKTDEPGYFVIITTIIPDIDYYEGQHRRVKHLTRLDFWTPEFDNLGVQALTKKEVYTPVDGDNYERGYNEDVFGFVPRYGEYKVGQSQITGDYLLQSRNVGKDSWNLFRSVKSYYDRVGAQGFVHDLNFVRGNDRSQYNRIFQVTDNTFDHFNIAHYFRITSSFPGKHLYDTYEFENDDTAQKVQLDNGGYTHN